MFFKSTIIIAAAALFAGQAIGAAIAEPAAAGGMLEKRIATDPYSACQGPRNSDHREGSSCEYYGTASDKSNTVSGTCHQTAEGLLCQA